MTRGEALAPADTCPSSACHCEPVRTLVRQSASPLPMVSCAETSLQTHLRHRLLHVIASQCAHWRGNPFSPQRNLASWHYFWQIRSTFPYSPKVLLSVMPCRRRSGLPRRGAAAPLLAMTGRNLQRVPIIPGHCRYAAAPCTRTPVSRMCKGVFRQQPGSTSLPSGHAAPGRTPTPTNSPNL